MKFRVFLTGPSIRLINPSLIYISRLIAPLSFVGFWRVEITACWPGLMELQFVINRLIRSRGHFPLFPRHLTAEYNCYLPFFFFGLSPTLSSFLPSRYPSGYTKLFRKLYIFWFLDRGRGAIVCLIYEEKRNITFRRVT